MTNQKEKFVKVPVKWFERLSYHAEICSCIDYHNLGVKEWGEISSLIGYSQSAKSILQLNLTEDEES